jgi:hypothetical protein
MRPDRETNNAFIYCLGAEMRCQRLRERRLRERLGRGGAETSRGRRPTGDQLLGFGGEPHTSRREQSNDWRLRSGMATDGCVRRAAIPCQILQRRLDPPTSNYLNRQCQRQDGAATGNTKGARGGNAPTGNATASPRRRDRAASRKASTNPRVPCGRRLARRRRPRGPGVPDCGRYASEHRVGLARECAARRGPTTCLAAPGQH